MLAGWRCAPRLGTLGMAGLFRTRAAREHFREKGWMVGTRLSTGPPEHGAYRSPIDRSFTAGRVKQSDPFIRGVVEALLDALTPRGEYEFVSEFCVPLPLRVRRTCRRSPPAPIP